MGWRSWNTFGGSITQEIMESTMRAFAAPFPGTNASLASFGYKDVGLDDVWQQCGSYGPQNWTYHDANGYPVVNLAKFPNMTNLPALAHSLSLSAGFYSNNCACADHCTCVLAAVCPTRAPHCPPTRAPHCPHPLSPPARTKR